MSIIEIIESRIARALRGLRFPYRARLTARDDAPGLQLAQGLARYGLPGLELARGIAGGRHQKRMAPAAIRCV